MKQIRYSIIIPHYNSIDGLQKLVSSIPDRDDIEVIVVDDNSDCDVHLDINLQCLTIYKLSNTTKTKGAGTCRNIGINQAVGEWLVFADADDFFVDGAFTLIDKEIDKNNDVIFFKPTSVSLINGSLSDRHVDFEDLVIRYNKDSDLSIKYKFYVPWSKVIRRAYLLDHNIYFDEVIASNDVMFSLKVGLNLEHFKVSESVIYCVTCGQGSLTKRYDYDVIRARFLVELERCITCREHGLDEYRNSFILILLKYRKVISLKDIKFMLHMVIKSKITFFPHNIRELIDIRVKRKKARSQ